MRDQNTVKIPKHIVFLSFFWRNKKFLIWVNSIVFIVAVIVSLLLPKWYKGSITFIVNEDTENSLISSLTGNLPINLLGGTDKNVLQYINFIYSRRVLDELDKRYNLQKLYEIEYRRKFYKELKSNIIVVDNDDNTISVDFYFKDDPKKAAQIANTIFELLYNLSSELKREKSKRMREFLEKSYTNTIERLKQAEKKLTDFQTVNEIYDAKSQLELMIKKIAELEIEKIQSEIEAAYLSKMVSGSDKKLKSLQIKIVVLKKKINQLKSGTLQNEYALNQMPEKIVKYYNLYRDVEILNKVIEFLVPQLENARLQEAKMDADIQLLDSAVPDDYKAKPKRIAIVFTATFLSLIMSILYIVAKRYYGYHKKEFKQVVFFDED